MAMKMIMRMIMIMILDTFFGHFLVFFGLVWSGVAWCGFGWLSGLIIELRRGGEGSARTKGGTLPAPPDPPTFES